MTVIELTTPHDNVLSLADDKPNLNDLLHMTYTGEDGKDVHVRLMDQVKSHWMRLAIALDFPEHDHEIAIMESQHDPVYCLLTKWLHGANMEKDPRPVTWETFIIALRDANIQEEATVLERHFIQVPKATSGKLMIYVYVKVDSFVIHAGFMYKYIYRFISYASNVQKNCQEAKLLGIQSCAYISDLCMYIFIL